MLEICLKEKVISDIFFMIKNCVDNSKQQEKPLYKVLNAFPGHGKTAALKRFLKFALEEDLHVGGLVVLKEKEQLREFESFLSSNQVLYIDSNNFYECKELIEHAQFVLITHERLKNIISLNKDKTLFTEWKNQRRMIFIDEMPIFFESHVFTLDGNMKWLNNCFDLLGNHIGLEETIVIRSLIQIMIAKELLLNKDIRTKPLYLHLENGSYTYEMNRFFKMIDEYLYELGDVNSISAYRFFKQLYYGENVGFIDPGIHHNGISNTKKIICSKRIDYRELGCSIVIFDGTAVYSKVLYNDEYDITEIKNEIDYSRIYFHQRIINTSARKRKTAVTKRGSVHENIASDILNIVQANGEKPFPLMNKWEINIYRKVQVIDEVMYKKYFESWFGEKNAINILNTIGKNYLREMTSIYLTSLPNRPPEYYKSIAVSIYHNAHQELNLSTLQKDKNNSNQWFADERIEQIYFQILLSELNQIIHRTKIREITSTEPIHIYIATKSEVIMKKLCSMFPGSHFEVQNVEENIQFERKLNAKAEYLLKRMRELNINKPTSIGRIEEKNDVKTFINPAWKDFEKRQKIIDVFEKYGMKIVILNNGEKRIELID